VFSGDGEEAQNDDEIPKLVTPSVLGREYKTQTTDGRSGRQVNNCETTVFKPRRRRQRAGGTCPPKFGKKYFSGKNHVKFGHFVNFSCIYFRAKMS